MNIKYAELVEVATKFLKENYNMELTIPIEYNTRTKRALGRFCYIRKGGKNIPTKLDMSVDAMRFHPKEHIIDVLKHELVHYALCVLEKPFSDGDRYFENELRRLGISSTQTYEVLGEFHSYQCINCNKTYQKKKKLNEWAYCICSKRPNLNYMGVVTKQFTAANEGK